MNRSILIPLWFGVVSACSAGGLLIAEGRDGAGGGEADGGAADASFDDGSEDVRLPPPEDAKPACFDCADGGGE